jgi:antibiotic biosynthesis monooxygenase (ABM) superfamily enzyme
MSTRSPLSTTATAAATTADSAPHAPSAHPPSVHIPSAHIPSVHIRAVITWLAIFPLVAIGLTILGPITVSWHPALRALVLTLLVVPAAVYIVVPKLFAGYGSLKRRQAQRAAAER